MKGSSYREQDYVFGQIMLTLRSRIGLTQTGLADALGVSRRAVADWEAGSKYPKADHLQTLIALGVQQGAFATGEEEAEIRALWKAARQKTFLDERWLAGLIGSAADAGRRGTDTPEGRPYGQRVGTGTRVDWGGAFAVQAFYGRAWEIDLLTSWVVGERCRVVTVMGMGGIGKSALTVNLMRQLEESFEVVIWRSLRDAPACDALIDDLLRVLSPAASGDATASLEQRLALLMDVLRQRRILLVLDNVESLMEAGSEDAGHLRAGYEGYGRLLRLTAETDHQSCLLLTSREKPSDLVPLEGNQSPVRSMRLNRLDAKSCEALLVEKGIAGTADERAKLIDVYTGNPLALKIVAQTVSDLFDGDVAIFLAQGEAIFGGVRALLEQQFKRLSVLEQNILLWLAVLREAAGFDDLMAAQVSPSSRGRLMESVEALYRRSLIERGQRAGSFTLQSVVLEYLTTRLIDDISREIEQGQVNWLAQYGLELATSNESVRQTQKRLLLVPILAQIEASQFQMEAVEALLIERLSQVGALGKAAQGYAPANLVALLRTLRGHLRGLDLSGLALRGVSLQGVDMQDARLTSALMQDCVFADTFDGIVLVSISMSGDYWAAVSVNGEVRVWTSEGRILYRLWSTDSGIVRRLSMSPDGRTLVASYVGGALKLLDIAIGSTIWVSGSDTGGTYFHIEFSPDGKLIATTGDLGIQIWDQASGNLRDTLEHPRDVPYLAWSPDGTILATGAADGILRLWAIHQDSPAVLLHTVEAHTNVISGIAFSQDGTRLVTGSWDGLVKLWDTADYHLQETLTGHKNRVFRAVWRADGRVIASSENDGTILLWDVETLQVRAALRAHTNVIKGLAFTPDSRTLVSGSNDGAIIVWDAETGLPNRIMHGYTMLVHMVIWSPDSQQLISVSSDTLLTRYSLHDQHPPRTIPMDRAASEAAWSPDGRIVATHRYDNAIRLWDVQSGAELDVIRSEDSEGYFEAVSWSADGQSLVVGIHNRGLHVFDRTTRTLRPFGEAHQNIGQLMWSPDGQKLLGVDTVTSTLYVWNPDTGDVLYTFTEHHGAIWSMGWSGDSQRLVTIGNSEGSTALFVWELASGQATRVNADLSSVSAVEWGAHDASVIVGDGNGALRWWDIATGACLAEVQAHHGRVTSIMCSPDRTMVASSGDDGGIIVWDAVNRTILKTLRRDRPYERMEIAGIRGLTEAQKKTLFALGAVESHP